MKLQATHAVLYRRRYSIFFLNLPYYYWLDSFVLSPNIVDALTPPVFYSCNLAVSASPASMRRQSSFSSSNLVASASSVSIRRHSLSFCFNLVASVYSASIQRCSQLGSNQRYTYYTLTICNIHSTCWNLPKKKLPSLS